MMWSSEQPVRGEKVCATRKDELASTHNYSKAMLGTLPLGESLG
jgi:hypothetical protein